MKCHGKSDYEREVQICSNFSKKPSARYIRWTDATLRSITRYHSEPGLLIAKMMYGNKHLGFSPNCIEFRVPSWILESGSVDTSSTGTMINKVYAFVRIRMEKSNASFLNGVDVGSVGIPSNMSVHFSQKFLEKEDSVISVEFTFEMFHF